MSSVIKFNADNTNWINIESKGRKIYNSNSFMRSLTNVMENPEFLNIFTEYFDNWDNIEIFVMFAKVYDSITRQFPDMSGYEKITLVKKIMETSKTRKAVCAEIMAFRETKSRKKIKY